MRIEYRYCGVLRGRGTDKKVRILFFQIYLQLADRVRENGDNGMLVYPQKAKRCQ